MHAHGKYMSGSKTDLEILRSANKLIEAEIRLWRIPERYGTEKIQEQKNPPVLSGEDFITRVIDPFVEKHPLTKSPKDLSFLNDPSADAFAEAHPEAVAGLLKYCRQYVVIGKRAERLDKITGGSSAVSDGIINAVDDAERAGKIPDKNEIIRDVLQANGIIIKPHGKGLTAARAAAHNALETLRQWKDAAVNTSGKATHSLTNLKKDKNNPPMPPR